MHMIVSFISNMWKKIYGEPRLHGNGKTYLITNTKISTISKPCK